MRLVRILQQIVLFKPILTAAHAKSALLVVALAAIAMSMSMSAAVVLAAAVHHAASLAATVVFRMVASAAPV
jgi:hypothetical protein